LEDELYVWNIDVIVDNRLCTLQLEVAPQ